MDAATTYKRYAWLLLLVPIYLFLFVKLDGYHVRLWDESYFAVHATEMWMNNSWIVPYFEGEPINEGTKPPLQTWLQIGFIQLLGLNELALRLPSAIAAALTVLLVFHFARKRFGELAGWISSLVLLTTQGFLDFHTGRGMEADALLTLWLVLQLVSFTALVESGRQRHLVWLGLWIALAFLSKSIAAFVLLPGFLIYLLWMKRSMITALIRSKAMIAFVLLGLGIPLAYIVVRESLFPGFIDFITSRHLGRVGESLGYFQSPWYYFKVWSSGTHMMWSSFGFLALAYVLAVIGKSQPLALLIGVVCVGFLVVIHLMSTKYAHYLNPSFPMFALLIGVAGNRWLKGLATPTRALLLTVVFIFPAYGMFMKSQANAIEYGPDGMEESAAYLWRAEKSGVDVDGLQVMHEGFSGALVFYRHKLAVKDQTILLSNEEPIPGDRVLTSIEKFQHRIERSFEVDTIDQFQNAIVYQIKSRKNE